LKVPFARNLLPLAVASLAVWLALSVGGGDNRRIARLPLAWGQEHSDDSDSMASDSAAPAAAQEPRRPEAIPSAIAGAKPVPTEREAVGPSRKPRRAAAPTPEEKELMHTGADWLVWLAVACGLVAVGLCLRRLGHGAAQPPAAS